MLKKPKKIKIHECKIEFDLLGKIKPNIHVIVKFDMYKNGKMKNIRVRTKKLSNDNI